MRSSAHSVVTVTTPLSVLPYRPSHCRPTCAVFTPSLRSPESSITSTPASCGALAGAEPVAGAQHAAVQRLQFFLSESRWDADRVNARRLELLRTDPATAPHDAGVLVIDDSGDRKDGTKTAHVGHQWLGRYGKT